MGGGNRNRERELEEQLRQQQLAQQQQASQYMATAARPDPLTERLRAQDTKWLDFEDATGEAKDITKAPGISPYLDLFNRAKSRRDSERMGIGALRLGTSGDGDSQMLARMKEQHDTEREENAAGQLENASRMKSAQVHGDVLPLAGFDLSRNMGLASLASGNAANSLNSYSNFLMRPRRPSFWAQLLSGGVSAASQALMV